MRTFQSNQPVTSIRAALTTAAALIAVWFLLSLENCTTLSGPRATAVDPPTEDRGAYGSRAVVTRFAPAGPIPLAQPLRPLRDRSRART